MSFRCLTDTIVYCGLRSSHGGSEDDALGAACLLGLLRMRQITTFQRLAIDSHLGAHRQCGGLSDQILCLSGRLRFGLILLLHLVQRYNGLVRVDHGEEVVGDAGVFYFLVQLPVCSQTHIPH